MVAMIECPNEVYIFPLNYKGKPFPPAPSNTRTILYAAVKANPVMTHLSVIAPSTRGAAPTATRAAQSLDFLVMHSYGRRRPPQQSVR